MEYELKVDKPSVIHIKSDSGFSVSVTPVSSGKMHAGILEAAIRSAGIGCTEELVNRMQAIEKLVDFQLTP